MVSCKFFGSQRFNLACLDLVGSWIAAFSYQQNLQKTVKMLILDRLARVIATTLKSVVCAVFVEMRVIWLWQPDNNFIGTFRYFVTSH